MNLLSDLDQALMSGNRPTELKSFAERILSQNIPGVAMKHIKVFNPQITEIDGKILTIKVAREKIQVILTAQI